MQSTHGKIRTCGSSLSSVHANSTTPGRTKQQKLSTWPLTTPSSPMIPRQNQMIFSSPRYSFSTFSTPSLPKCGFRDAWSRHSSVHISVLQNDIIVTNLVAELTTTLKVHPNKRQLPFLVDYLKIKTEDDNDKR